MRTEVVSLGYKSAEKYVTNISLEHSSYLLNDEFDRYIDFKVFSEEKIPM